MTAGSPTRRCRFRESTSLVLFAPSAGNPRKPENQSEISVYEFAADREAGYQQIEREGMAASELSELRAELWRTRDDLERIKSRGTPPSADCSPRRHFDRRRHRGSPSPTPATATAREEIRHKDRDHRRNRHSEQHKGDGLEGGGGARGYSGGGIRSGPTSPPTSGGSSPGSGADYDDEAPRGLGGTEASGSSPGGRKLKFGSSRGGVGSASSEGENAAKGGSSEEVAAEETLCNLELEGAAFKNWTEEASSIAVRLIEEVKMLRWEKGSWAERERTAEREAERAAAEARAQADHLEERLGLAEADGKRVQEALARAQQDVERERARAKTERAKAEGLRAAAATAAAEASALRQEKEKMQLDQQQERAKQEQQHRDTSVGGGGGLVEMLRREKEGADALQRRLDMARAASARHEKERKEWRSSKARLEELRRSWGKQLKKVGGGRSLASLLVGTRCVARGRRFGRVASMWQIGNASPTTENRFGEARGWSLCTCQGCPHRQLTKTTFFYLVRFKIRDTFTLELVCFNTVGRSRWRKDGDIELMHVLRSGPFYRS